VKKPDWFKSVLAAEGAKVLSGKVTRSEARAAIDKAVLAHPEHLADLVAVLDDRDLGHWLKERQANGDLFQTALFPELPVRMRVTPNESAEVASMDAHQLEMAKRMLFARTENQIAGAKAAAEHEQDVFMDFFRQVRPLLADGLTVRDVLGRIQAAA
jgi:hypothetical protein